MISFIRWFAIEKHLCHITPRLMPLVLALTVGFSAGCSKELKNGSNDSVAPPVPPVSDPNAGLDVRKMAANATSYAITYGALDTGIINTLKSYPLVIVHPYNGNISAEQIMQIKQGEKPTDPGDNAVVLCYISIGEDSRTFDLTDTEMLADSRFTGDGSGPSIDPRAAGVRSLVISPDKITGMPTNRGFASYYLNDNAVRCKGEPDGKPDNNPIFKTRFVNAGDPAWYQIVKKMTMDSGTHTPPGLTEMLTTSYGKGLGCDGLFLDTIDTAAPNAYTGTICSDTENYSNSEWTAQGFTGFMKQIRADFPGKVILQNRGLFFFDPRLPHYEVSARGTIDIGYFESYYLDNNAPEPVVSDYFPDNKYNVAPKLMAEANRPGADGFKVLSLGYANGFNDVAKNGIDINTLVGGSTLGFDILRTDMKEAQEVGLYPYITSASVDFMNSFVKTNSPLTDTTPPKWTSVYNVNYNAYPPPPPVPRIGIQNVKSEATGTVTLSWDVALDMHKVSYLLYYQTFPVPFDFAKAVKLPLTPLVGDGYDTIWNSSDPNEALRTAYPYQQTISGLQSEMTYYFVIRAVDAVGNEDDNSNIKSVTIK
ncbi:MAG: fibronectin type III domain-containing protein [Desulfuromonadaceae bacterium]|nr:fibronectin type III domain-containing protein [Desulfuromonadaceae bacterium]